MSGSLAVRHQPRSVEAGFSMALIANKLTKIYSKCVLQITSGMVTFFYISPALLSGILVRAVVSASPQSDLKSDFKSDFNNNPTRKVSAHEP